VYHVPTALPPSCGSRSRTDGRARSSPQIGKPRHQTYEKATSPVTTFGVFHPKPRSIDISAKPFHFASSVPGFYANINVENTTCKQACSFFSIERKKERVFDGKEKAKHLIECLAFLFSPARVGAWRL